MFRKGVAAALGFCFFLSGCMPEVIVKSRLKPDQKLRVAVLPFKDAPGHAGSGSVATEVFSAHLLSVGGYNVVDRGALDKVLEEQKLGQSGAIDSSKAVEIGKLVGADAIVMGAVTEYQERNLLILPPAKIGMAVRLIDTRTSEVGWSVEYSMGGPARLLTWVIPIIGAVATAISPSAQDLLSTASGRICDKLQKELASLTPHG